MAPSAPKRGVAALSDNDAASSASHSPSTTTTSKRRRRASAAGRGEDSTTRASNNSSQRRSPIRRARTPGNGFTRVVTPSQVNRARTSSDDDSSTAAADDNDERPVRRALLQSPGTADNKKKNVKETPKAKKRIAFGRVIVETPCQKNVQDIYKIISKLTGSVGGNGSFGAIYGELTVGSMQKMVDLMKSYTNFTSASRMIDVGSGLGKPNLHVCQDPGVEFSYGIEMEMSRWMLGMANLQAIVKVAKKQAASGGLLEGAERIGSNCIFDHGNIMDALSFDPFTHVYMFSIGFPPRLWRHLAEMFNRSSAPYLICYHSPSDIISKYGFNVKLVVQAPTSMHGSSEGHMGYIYERIEEPSNEGGAIACDPLFKDAWEAVKGGIDVLDATVESRMQESCHNGRLTRSRGVKMTVVSSIEQKEEAEKDSKKKGRK